MKKNKQEINLHHPKHSLKNKIQFYVLVILLLMTLLSIYSLAITHIYKNKIDTMFIRNIQLNEVKTSLDTVNNELVAYLSTKSSNSLNNYLKSSENIKNLSYELIKGIDKYSDDELMLLDIRNMLYNYVEQADIAVAEKRKSDVSAYTQRYENTLQIREYINEYLTELNTRQLDINAAEYLSMTEHISQSTVLNILLIINLVFLSLIVMASLTNSIITPIIKLSRCALNIAEGKFETEEVKVDTNDEMQILVMSFDQMKNNIFEYIEELKEKAHTEAQLSIQQMENLRMQALLDSARLYALQSQMNPHFLFNCINAGVQLAVMEGADRTSEFLECMSRIYRYNIKNLDTEVTIGDEIKNITDYYELLKVRFGDLIKFSFNIDERCLGDKIPPLIIQPIVENAYIHGLSKKEEGGNIWIEVTWDEKYSQIVIEDDGVGMEPSLRDMLNSYAYSRETDKALPAKNEVKDEQNTELRKGRTNGIGMKNLIERMSLFFKQNGLIMIESEPGYGTRFTVLVPHGVRDERKDFK